MMKKHCVLALLLLTVNYSAFACGFYPYGEDIRYSFLRPKAVFPKSNDWFFYSSRDYYNSDYDFDIYSKEQLEENLLLWFNQYNGSFSQDDIYEAVYSLPSSELKNTNSNNLFIRELNKKEHLADRDYLIYAKTVSSYNFNVQDYWETEPKGTIKKRKKYISKTLGLAKSAKSEILKRRYAHLAIRLAFYAEDGEKVRSIYQTYFNTGEFRDAIDYWALSFKLQFDESSLERNLSVVRVFLHSKEKRFAVHDFYDWSYSLDELLNSATSQEDKIAIHYYHGCRNNGRALKHIDEIAKIDPKHPSLEFLVLREVNKLEDWILTPQYTYFDPSSRYSYWYSSDESKPEKLEAGIVEDRGYALQVLNVLQKYDEKISHGTLYQQYLRYMTRNFDHLSADIEKGLTSDKEDPLNAFRRKLLVLTKVAADEDPSLENKLVQEVLMTSQSNKFLLAVAMELEHNGHKNRAALVLSHVNRNPEENDESYYGALWKTPKMHSSLESDYYYEYFTYIDVMYSVQDIQGLIFYLKHEPVSEEFDKWLVRLVKKEETRLYDLMGTMYLRKNDLNSALSAFEQVNDTLWNSQHYAYKTYIHDDPFNNDFYWKTDYRHLEEVKKKYTKPEIVKELLKQLEIVKTATGNKKAKAAYRVANCYRNMSFYGNAWMMRRYFWTANTNLTGLEDDTEYFHCLEAQKYYKIAYENATSPDFKKLSLRMQGLCEGYQLAYESDSYYVSYEEQRILDKLNSCYKKLRKEYGEDYTWSNCEAYQGYYESIK